MIDFVYKYVVLLWVLISCCSKVQGNLAFNGSFDTNRDGWQGEGWIDDYVKHGGSGSLCIERNAIHSVAPLPQNDGKSYEFRCWIKCEGCLAKSVTVQVRCADEEGRLVGSWLPGTSPERIHGGGSRLALLATGGTHDWQSFSCVIPSKQIPKTAALLHVYLRRDAIAETLGDAWFDDVEVREVNQRKRMITAGYLRKKHLCQSLFMVAKQWIQALADLP